MNINSSVSELNFVLLISRPPKITEKWFCIQNLCVNISFQEKNGLIIQYLVAEILSKNRVSFFWDTLYIPGISLVYIQYITGIYQQYHIYISGIFRVYLGKSQAYHGVTSPLFDLLVAAKKS